MRRDAVRAFTIVELLVVVSIIAILLALLVSGITGALKTSKNSKQLSNLRQLFTGWTLYANQYNDQCLPGFLSVEVQKLWKVTYHMKEKVEGQSSDKFDRAATQTYPWRLAPYLDYSWELLLGYRDHPNSSSTGSIYTIAPLEIASASQSAALRQLCPSATMGASVALQPAYGYNAFYLGGWWDISKNPKSPGIARPYFSDGLRIGTGKNQNAGAITRTIGGIAIPDRMTVFAPAAYLAANMNSNSVKDGYRILEPSIAGAAWLTPPWLGTERIWSTSNNDPFSLTMYTDQAAALMRYSKQIPAAKGDGSTKLENYQEFTDMREWLNLTDISNAQMNSAVHTGTFLDQ